LALASSTTTTATTTTTVTAICRPTLDENVRTRSANIHLRKCGKKGVPSPSARIDGEDGV
jgi:hypothetical protein